MLRIFSKSQNLKVLSQYRKVPKFPCNSTFVRHTWLGSWGYAWKKNLQRSIQNHLLFSKLCRHVFATSWQNKFIPFSFACFIQMSRIKQSMQSVLSIIVGEFSGTECCSADVSDSLTKRARGLVAESYFKGVLTANTQFRNWRSTSFEACRGGIGAKTSLS